MVRKGFSALDAKKRIEDRDPSARAELVSEMSKRPVILNRAPTLYKHGLVGSFPKLVSGKTIQVNPFIEKGMNLDYDGDALQVHLPATEGGINDAKKMLVSRNVFADITQGKALATPAMEAVAGMYMAGMKGKSSKTTRVFETKGEALAAYRSGSINLNDPVEIRRA
jgi:DNA-directed RNA polymerase subunit beta'